MSWKEMSAMDLRLEFVSLALAEGANIKALCEHFNIGRTTAYKWLKRFQCEGKDGLRNQPRRPRTSPNRTAPESEKQILALNIEHTGWGARKIKGCLERRGSTMPAASTVHAILKRRHECLDDFGYRRIDRKSTRLNSSHVVESRMPSSA